MTISSTNTRYFDKPSKVHVASTPTCQDSGFLFGEVMKEKECFKCKDTKPLSEFYKHKDMKDGRLNKCKECTKNDVHKNYVSNRKYYSEYERKRNQSPERKAAKLKYQTKKRAKFPVKYKAWKAVGNAIRDGRLKRKPCEVCKSKKVQAHHDDYSKPLDVRWLCFKHHREHHGQTVI